MTSRLTMTVRLDKATRQIKELEKENRELRGMLNTVLRMMRRHGGIILSDAENIERILVNMEVTNDTSKF